jgi:hypothetical protein
MISPKFQAQIAQGLGIRNLDIGTVDVLDSDGQAVAKLIIEYLYAIEARYRFGKVALVVVSTPADYRVGVILPNTQLVPPEQEIRQLKIYTVPKTEWQDLIAERLQTVNLLLKKPRMVMGDSSYTCMATIYAQNLMTNFMLFGPTQDKSLTELWQAIMLTIKYLAQLQNDELAHKFLEKYEAILTSEGT